MAVLVDESAATDLTNWSDESGAGMSTGTLTLSSSNYYAKHDTTLPDDCWWRFTVESSAGTEYFIPKSTASGTGFGLHIGSNGSRLDMSFFEFWNTTFLDGGFAENTPAENNVTYTAGTDVIAITLETSTDTMSVWVNPSNAEPYDLDNWDSSSDPADYTWTCSKDLSTVGGSWGFNSASSTTASFSDITAGDFAAGSATTLIADSATYTYTGYDATLISSLASLLTAESGGYDITGSATDLIIDTEVAGTSGNYALTGYEATLSASSVNTLTAETGTFTYTGSAAAFNLAITYPLTAEPGNYLHSGLTAALDVVTNSTLSADSGYYVYLGLAANLTATPPGRILIADAGSYAHTGLDITITAFSEANVFSADAGSYGCVGQQAALTWKIVRLKEPLTIVPTVDTGRRVGDISPSNPVPGQTPVYIIGADGDIYVAQDDLGLIVEI